MIEKKLVSYLPPADSRRADDIIGPKVAAGITLKLAMLKFVG